MPSYKFTYFNGKGRAEVSRLLFAAAGKAFDDVRIDSAQWSDLKKVMPQGTLPVLEVGGKTKISQSAKKREEFLAGDAKKYLGFLENLVKEGGKSGFAVGSSLTVADLMLYAFIENSQIVELLKDYKLLDANRKKVEQLPKIKEYLAKRPVTTF
ncbi:GST-like protein [Mya arenaria]|uniref:glutathione transferase n=1 Tax=Mya arenaria TaxID=6604 RepID=A0ABY7FW26_MYAAR|nr:GST-like protein [Mya arenaria]